MSTVKAAEDQHQHLSAPISRHAEAVNRILLILIGAALWVMGFFAVSFVWVAVQDLSLFSFILILIAGIIANYLYRIVKRLSTYDRGIGLQVVAGLKRSVHERPRLIVVFAVALAVTALLYYLPVGGIGGVFSWILLFPLRGLGPMAFKLELFYRYTLNLPTLGFLVGLFKIGFEVLWVYFIASLLTRITVKSLKVRKLES
ncbi:MAG: hypothetical protein ACE5JP_04870 [Candidatus Bipolaricaulia bacterium]